MILKLSLDRTQKLIRVNAILIDKQYFILSMYCKGGNYVYRGKFKHITDGELEI